MTDDRLRQLGDLTVVPREDLMAPAPSVARALLGAVISTRVAGAVVRARIVETEAYRQDDPASHSSRGQTPTTAPMFGPPGICYVYFVYGMHHCMNVSCEAEGVGAAVLLRSGVVIDGLPTARDRRPAARDRDLARGPACLTRALGVDRAFSGADLLADDGSMQLARDSWAPPPREILTGPRTGVRWAADVPWRFWIRDVPEVSAHRRHRNARR